MKKALSILLAVVLVLGCLPLTFASAGTTAEPENLAANYNVANGNISWDSGAGSWGENHSSDKPVYSGNYWTFGLTGGGTQYVYIKATDLKANTQYDFSYCYQQDYKILFDHIEDATGVTVDLLYSQADIALTVEGIDTPKQTKLAFATTSAGDYVITLKMNKNDYPNNRDDWSRTVLSDLVLTENTNLAKYYNVANGNITANDKAGGTIESVSVFGGTAWLWGIGSASDVNNLALLNIKATGLKANTVYDFSYIQQRDFDIRLSGITYGDATLNTIKNVGTTVALTSGQNAKQKEFSFKTDAAGDYIITLKSCKTWHLTSNWDGITLSDLVLTERAAEDSLNLAEFYTKANGNITADSNTSAWGDISMDCGDSSIYGGMTWSFGTTNETGYITVKATDLEANTKYDFTYYYQQDYRIEYQYMLDPSDEKHASVKAYSPVAITVDGIDTPKKVDISFKTDVAGDYKIVLATDKDWPNNRDDWSRTVLSDLQLYKRESSTNLAEFYNIGNGNLTQDSYAGNPGSDSASGSLFGGYCWKFDATNSTNDISGNIYITTEALKAHTEYTFTYHYYKDYKIVPADVTLVAEGATALNGVSATDPIAVEGTANTLSPKKVVVTFVTDAAGAYKIRLQINKFWKNIDDWRESYLCDLILTEGNYVSPVTAGFTSSTANDPERTGVSMRKAEGETLQALRYKNTIDADTLAKKELAENGYTLVEYGSIAMRDEFLDGAELVLTDTINSRPVLKGVAYNATTDIRFANNADGSITFTAALYNIGKTTGSDVIDYSVWGKAYTVRAYALFRNAAGAEVVVYGEQASASVFDVMAAIQAGDNQADQDYVASLLENTEIAAAYATYTEQ